MDPTVRNLFEGADAPGREDFFALLAGRSFRLERIVSRGQPTPPGEWYDQTDDEWVMLAQGEALLLFDNGPSIAMRPGDYLLIPAGCRHRVERTSSDAVWLALHFDLEHREKYPVFDISLESLASGETAVVPLP